MASTIVWSTDAFFVPFAENITVATNENESVAVVITGFDSTDPPLQMSFTAKLLPTDADSAATTVQKIINGTQSAAGVFSPLSPSTYQASFALLPADETQLLTSHTYGIKVFTAKYPLGRTLQTGSIVANQSLTTFTASTTASLTVTPSPASVGTGQTVQLTATPKDAFGTTLTGKTITWQSSNAAVASVNAATGLVTGVASGSCTITATCDGLQASTAVTCAQALDGSLADLRSVATDALLYGVYSGVSGVVLDGSNNVSTWNDVRGATGYGPPLTQATANARPAYNAGTGTLTFDGVRQVLASATLSALALTTRPIAIGYVGTIANGVYFAGLISADGSRLLALGTPAGVVRLHTPTADASTSYAAPDATTRALLAQYGFAPTVPGDATSSTAWLGVEVEPKLRTLANPESSIEASGDTGISIGGLSFFGQFGAIAVKEFVIFAGEVTAPVRAAFERYANARGALAIAANKRGIAGVDSITAGFNVLGDGTTTDPTKSYFGQAITDGTLVGYDTANMGTPGRWITTVAQRSGYLAGEARAGDVLFVLGGTNDLQGGRTPAQIAADIKTVCLAWKAGGGRVILIGPTPRTGYDVTPINTILTTFDTTVRDVFVNPQNITALANPADVSIYPDGLHMLTIGHTHLLNDANGIKSRCTAAGFIF